jgi:hypothetical protein
MVDVFSIHPAMRKEREPREENRWDTRKSFLDGWAIVPGDNCRHYRRQLDNLLLGPLPHLGDSSEINEQASNRGPKLNQNSFL